MNIHTQNNLAKDEEYLNTKELIFINAYVQTGNATQSYIKAFNIPQNRYHSATVLASKLKKKIHSLDQLYYENNGLNARSISTVIKGAMKAKKQVIYKGIHDYPDHTTRLRAIEVYDRLVNKEESKNSQQTMMTGLNIIIQK